MPSNDDTCLNMQAAASMAKKIEIMEDSKRKLLGHGLESYSTVDLQQTQYQLERSLRDIRARKKQSYKLMIEQMKGKERILETRNEELRNKFKASELQPVLHLSVTTQEIPERECSDVDTDLFLGRPPER